MAEDTAEPNSSLYYMDSIKCRLDCPEIPTLVKLYRPLIVRCLKVEDVVHYLDGVINTRMIFFIVSFKCL